MKRSLIAMLLLSGSLNAGVSDLINNSFSDVGDFVTNYMDSVSEEPTSIKGQTRGLYTLGGTRIRLKDTGSFQPVNFEMPSIKFGCGGIDGIFGSFSYLDEKYLVQKGKAIVANAPAFAFQMALATLDKETQATMQEIEKVLQAMNSFNIDSCKASQRLASFAMGKMEDSAQSNLNSGQTDDYLDQKGSKSASQIVGGWVNSANSFFNGDSAKTTEATKEKYFLGSLLKQAITNSSLSGLNTNIIGKDALGDSLLESFARDLVGDLIGYKSGSASEFTFLVKAVPMSGSARVKDFIEGGNLSYVSVQEKSDNLGEPVINYKVKNNFQGMLPLFKERIANILSEMRSKQKLSVDNRKFIQSLPLPIYNFLNTTAMSGADNDTLLAEYLAIMESQVFFDLLLSGVGKTVRNEISKKTDEDNYNKAKDIALNLIKIKSAIDTEMNLQIVKFDSKQKLVNQYRTFRRELENNIGYF